MHSGALLNCVPFCSDKAIKALYEYMVLKHPRKTLAAITMESVMVISGSCLARVEHVIRIVEELLSHHNGCQEERILSSY